MKKILAAKPSITQLEIDYVTDAVTTGWGENCYNYLNRFTDALKDYFDVPFAWPTSSCHGALHMVLMALGVGPGDEVIVPDATWVGSVFPITWLGATPVFVDVLPDTWCIAPKEIQKAITNNTKAIIAVHLYGNLCEMDEIIEISKTSNIPIVEDAAEALGSEYKGRKAGSIGDFGVCSFHGTKTMTTGEGGVVLARGEKWSDKISILDSQGRKVGAKLFWVDEVGLKYKMSNMDAALGLAQIERMDDLVQKKREVFKWYAEKLLNIDGITMNIEQDFAKNSYWMPTVIFDNSLDLNIEEVIQKANNEGISLRPFFYPVSSFPMYETRENHHSLHLSQRGLNLPSYYDMTRSEVDRVLRFINHSTLIVQITQ